MLEKDVMSWICQISCVTAALFLLAVVSSGFAPSHVKRRDLYSGDARPDTQVEGRRFQRSINLGQEEDDPDDSAVTPGATTPEPRQMLQDILRVIKAKKQPPQAAEGSSDYEDPEDVDSLFRMVVDELGGLTSTHSPIYILKPFEYSSDGQQPPAPPEEDDAGANPAKLIEPWYPTPTGPPEAPMRDSMRDPAAGVINLEVGKTESSTTTAGTTTEQSSSTASSAGSTTVLTTATEDFLENVNVRVVSSEDLDTLFKEAERDLAETIGQAYGLGGFLASKVSSAGPEDDDELSTTSLEANTTSEAPDTEESPQTTRSDQQDDTEDDELSTSSSTAGVISSSATSTSSGTTAGTTVGTTVVEEEPEFERVSDISSLFRRVEEELEDSRQVLAKLQEEDDEEWSSSTAETTSTSTSTTPAAITETSTSTTIEDFENDAVTSRVDTHMLLPGFPIHAIIDNDEELTPTQEETSTSAETSTTVSTTVTTNSPQELDDQEYDLSGLIDGEEEQAEQDRPRQGMPGLNYVVHVFVG